MTDFKVGDIAEVRDNGPILKAGERFTVKEVLGQWIRIDRPGTSNVFSSLISARSAVATQLENLSRLRPPWRR